MRVGPIGFAFNTFDEVLNKAKESAVVTHNHPEVIKSAKLPLLRFFSLLTNFLIIN